jgi:hypothetical protein
MCGYDEDFSLLSTDMKPHQINGFGVASGVSFFGPDGSSLINKNPSKPSIEHDLAQPTPFFHIFWQPRRV